MAPRTSWMCASAALLALLLAACNTRPPRHWLRFQAIDHAGWTQTADGRLRAGVGAAIVHVDLGQQDTRIEITVDNPGDRALLVHLGDESARPTAAIGEVFLRPIGAAAGEDVPDALPYRALQPREVLPGWRARFFLDSPLGRDLVLGQQVMLLIETRDPANGARDHRTLPLMATNVRAEEQLR